MAMTTDDLVLACAVGLCACQAAPPDPRPLFEVASPKQGTALMYLFRPEVDKVGRADRPTLLINGQAVGVIGYATYTMVSLGPGRHVVKLIPGTADDAAWKTELEFEVRAEQTYFVAIWNQNQPGPIKQLFVPVGSTFLFVPVGGFVTGEQNVRFEAVDRDIGRYALSGLRYVASQVGHFSPR